MNQPENYPANEKIKINLSGSDPEVFNRVFSKLAETIEKAVGLLSMGEISGGMKENINDTAAIAQNYFEAKLRKPSIENEKYMAEITERYASAQEKIANVKKIQAETESIAIDNAAKKVQAAIKMLALLSEVSLQYSKGNQSLILDFSIEKAL